MLWQLSPAVSLMPLLWFGWEKGISFNRFETFNAREVILYLGLLYWCSASLDMTVAEEALKVSHLSNKAFSIVRRNCFIAAVVNSVMNVNSEVGKEYNLSLNVVWMIEIVKKIVSSDTMIGERLQTYKHTIRLAKCLLQLPIILNIFEQIEGN